MDFSAVVIYISSREIQVQCWSLHGGLGTEAKSTDVNSVIRILLLSSLR